jgi:YggT family protein
MEFLFSIIRYLCWVLTMAILARVIISWFSPSPTNSLAIILYQVTELFLAPLRRIVPRVGIFDFTPLVAVVLLQLIASLLP